MNAIKKIISLALVTTMVSAMNIPKQAYAEENNFLKENFDNISSVSDLAEDWEFKRYLKGGTNQSYTPEIVSDNDGNVIKVTKTAEYDQVRAVYVYPEALGGSLKIKYSIKPGENLSNLVSLSETTNWVTCFGPDHSLSFRWAGSDTIPYTVARNLTYDEWYDCELYVDTVGLKAQLKVSDRKGNSWESDVASITPDKFKKLYFRCWGGEGSFCFDDVEVEQLPLGFGIETDKVGNIFDQDDDETFEVVIGNNASEKIKGVMEWELRNEYTNEIKKGVTDFNISAKRDKKFDLTLDVKEFGAYTLKAKVKYYKDGVLVDENEPKKVKFTKILASKNGEKNPQFGFATANITHEPGTPEQAFQLIEKAGAKGIRNFVSWPTAETADRVLGINKANSSVLQAMSIRDTEDMITLGYGHKDIVSQTKLEKQGFLFWEKEVEVEMEPDNWRAPWKDEDVAAFARYCAYVAEQTKEHTRYYEIWNEWDGAFNVDVLDEKAYVKILKAAYTAIKEVHPDALVVSNSFGGNDAFQKALDAGMYEYSDAFICHGYMAQSYFPSSVWLNKYETRLKMIRDYEAKMGYTTKKYMIFNENGISTAVDYVPNNNNWRTVTEAEQAEIAVKYVAFLFNHDITESIYWFTLTDTGVDSKQKEDMWGVMYHPKNFEKVYLAKPSYASIAAMNRLMNGGIENTEWEAFELTEKRDERWNANGSNLKPMGDMDCYLSCAYPFKRRADDGLGEHMAIIWSDEQARNFTLKLGCETVDMYDLFGNKTTLTSADGVYDITVDDTLIYLLGDFTTFEQASGSISTAEFDKKTGLMHIAGIVNDVNLVDGSVVPVQIYEDGQLVDETSVKVVNGAFDKQISVSKEGTYLIKVGDYAEKELEIATVGEYGESIISSIDSGLSIYVDDKKNICIEGKVNNFAEDENVSLIVVPQDEEVNKDNILYIKQLAIESDGSFADKVSLLSAVPVVDIYISATNASRVQSAAGQGEIFKVISLNLEEQNVLNASAVIYNTTDVDEDAIIIVAQYGSNNELVDFYTRDITVLKNEQHAQVFNCTVDKKESASKCKAFIWKSITDLVPLFESVSIGE